MTDTKSVTMDEQDRLEGRAVHAEAKAAAAEQRAAVAELQALLCRHPEVAQAQSAVVQAERALAAALEADRAFRAAIGDKLGMDMSDPGSIRVDWKTGTVTAAQPDAPEPADGGRTRRSR